MKEKRLVRKSNDRMFLGVSAGIAEYINVDPVFVRLAFVLLTILGKGTGLVLYFILAIIMPEETVPAAKANAFDEEEIIIKDA